MKTAAFPALGERWTMSGRKPLCSGSLPWPGLGLDWTWEGAKHLDGGNMWQRSASWEQGMSLLKEGDLTDVPGPSL